MNIGPSTSSLNESFKHIQAKKRLDNRRYQEADLIRLNGRGSVRDMPCPQKLSNSNMLCPQGLSTRETPRPQSTGLMILESQRIRQGADQVLGRSSHRHSHGQGSKRDMSRPHHGSNKDMPCPHPSSNKSMPRPHHGFPREAPRPSPYRREERPSSRRP